MSFKKLVEMIAAAETVEDLNECCGAVDRSYQSEKISFKVNELLYKLSNKLALPKAAEFRHKKY